jgi:hypothetical protein
MDVELSELVFKYCTALDQVKLPKFGGIGPDVFNVLFSPASEPKSTETLEDVSALTKLYRMFIFISLVTYLMFG